VTEIGQTYYEHVKCALAVASKADAAVSAMQAKPAGQLRVAAETDFGTHCLSVVVGEFLDKYPKVTVQLELFDRAAEQIPEGAAVCLRSGMLPDSQHKTTKIYRVTRWLVASPTYLERAGQLKRIDDLFSGHQLLRHEQSPVWLLTASSGEQREVRTSGRFTVGSSQALLNAALSGAGIALLPSYLCTGAVADGRLVRALPELPPLTEDVYALYWASDYTPPSTRAFIEFLQEEFSI